jgi:DNA-binding winged helix-turn-helix (wHTH) protein
VIYRFADCELDTARYELRRGGHLITLEPKVFQVLEYLCIITAGTLPKTSSWHMPGLTWRWGKQC